MQSDNTVKIYLAMKKTVNVSLGGMVFCLEEDAYIRLDRYLKGLEQRFKKSKDVREIMNDIESRIAEHFKERMSFPEMVINLVEVERVIGIMGNPSDFDDNDVNAESSSYNRSPGGSRKRFFRDPENSVIAGVCSGLSYYWNIDVVIIRILFVILAFWGGGGVIIYIILWIVIPEALTVADRLEMTGEPVNAQNIGKSFDEPKK